MEDLENKLRCHVEGGPCPTDLIREYAERLRRSSSLTEEHCPVFSDRYPTLFKLIRQGADMSLLDMFLSRLEHVQEGKKQVKDVENELASELNERYVRPKLRESGLE
jgi:hypothetical protein